MNKHIKNHDDYTTSIEYILPCNSEEDVERVNKMSGENYYKTLEEHGYILANLLLEGINENLEYVNDGVYYMGDGIRVKIDIIYEPENK